MSDPASFSILGRLERAPTERPTAKGKVVSLFVKTIEQLNPDGSVRVRAQSFPITVFSEYLQTRVISQLNVGNIVVITGKLDRRSYQAQGSDKSIWNNELVANSILIVGGITSQAAVYGGENDGYNAGDDVVENNTAFDGSSYAPQENAPRPTFAGSMAEADDTPF